MMEEVETVFCGRPPPAAISVIDRDEVFDAKIPSK
jgi:hypothetical protein